MNYKLVIQYDGTDFHGWQVQNNQRTVQGELERVLSLIEGTNVNVSGSGRTDAGVHAEGQVANVKLLREFRPQKLRAAINGNLRGDLRIIEAIEVEDDFHARFSARGKTYLYRIVNSPVISPFWARYAHHEMRPLDVSRMNENARLFLGEHDWTAFSNAQSDSDNKVRTISSFEVTSVWDTRSRSAIVEFRITGNGFLRYMVRSMVGTLLEVGRCEREGDSIQEAIISRNRDMAGVTAPANGLTLLEVQY
ncbi:MAG: tRNA pseudouridine(38-40) synthase TruA [Pyrinomonadaceae bacterium]